MKTSTRITAGITVLTLPTVQFGGHFLLNILSGREEALGLTAFQESMFRAGHAHAGTLVTLALVALLLSARTRLSGLAHWLVCLGFPLSAVLMSGGFFAAAIGSGVTRPTPLIALLYAGAALLAASALTLGVALLRGDERPSATEARP